MLVKRALRNRKRLKKIQDVLSIIKTVIIEKLKEIKLNGRMEKIKGKRRHSGVFLSILLIALVAAALLALFFLDRWGIIGLDQWLVVRAITDGSVLRSIKEWLSTPLGLQLILAALISLLLVVVGIFLIRRLKRMHLKKGFISLGERFKKKIESIKPRALHIKLGTYETGIDALYLYILKKEKITLEEVAERFKITKGLAEEWAKTLESHQLIAVSYSP